MSMLEEALEEESLELLVSLDPSIFFKDSNIKTAFKDLNESYMFVMQQLDNSKNGRRSNYIDTYYQQLNSYLAELNKVSSNMQASINNAEFLQENLHEKDSILKYIINYRKVSTIVWNAIESDKNNINDFFKFVCSYDELTNSQEVTHELKKIQKKINSDFKKINSNKGILKRLYDGIIQDCEEDFDGDLLKGVYKLQAEINENNNNMEVLVNSLSKTYEALTGGMVEGIVSPYADLVKDLENQVGAHEKTIDEKYTEASERMSKMLRGGKDEV